MSRRKSPVLAALFKLTRAGVRQSARIGREATRQGVEAGGKLAEQAGQRPASRHTQKERPLGAFLVSESERIRRRAPQRWPRPEPSC